ncbi:hypothetical protein WI61_24905 [Burkholderia cepacia]|nr:hypothetical protein WI48_17220 [Burkholderia cepacia]KVA62479.1 hypothetical protein WI47_03710 [Burkholderia cepacia]KVA70920.1 hypothetical protein WI49_05490 [Burkholderia cepacia]KVA89420.1 hypothetical protein WI50_11385 [Burkholderia cepacia]KVA95169.1 hypothetical protein WI51_38785 [Burkholderia cepacia]
MFSCQCQHVAKEFASILDSASFCATLCSRWFSDSSFYILAEKMHFMVIANRVTDTVKSVSLFWSYRRVFTMASLEGQVF